MVVCAVGRPGEDDDGEAENGGEETAAEEGHGTDSEMPAGA